MSHWAHLNIWPDAFISLNAELIRHPELQRMLSHLHISEWELRMAQIAVYCDVILDGTYTPVDMEYLADILTKKLKTRREDHRGLLVLSAPAPTLIGNSNNSESRGEEVDLFNLIGVKNGTDTAKN